MMVELISDLMANPLIPELLPLGGPLEFREHDPQLEKGRALHGQPVAAAGVVALMSAQKLSVLVD